MMDFYYDDTYTVCRSVMLTAKVLGIDLNKKKVNIEAKEQLKPEFLSLNFQHVVPTLVDGDLILWESRAICTYLITKYGKSDSLYPTDAKQRALIDRLLYFDFSLLSSLREYLVPIFRQGTRPDESKIDTIQVNLDYLNQFLDGQDYAVENNVTVADLCLMTTVSTAEAIGIDISLHNNVVSWFMRCKKNIPEYQIECEEATKRMGEYFMKVKNLAQ